MSETRLTLGQCAALASIIEATVPKPGNVHRGADFEDVTYPDFVVSGIAIGPVFDRAEELSVGEIVLSAVEATQRLVGTNTNLGMILLFAPLAKVPRHEPLVAGVQTVLASLTADDARAVYAAIRLAKPGGLGRVDKADVHDAPPESLLDAMHLAADRDLVARQYAEGFHHVLALIVPWLTSAIRERQWPISQAVAHAFLRLLAIEPDSLIARKRGLEVAQQASARAARVLSYGEPGNPVYHEALADFDFWLRSDHHHRNPGTTVDLIAAGLFVCLRDGIMKAPFRLTESASEE
jgi:triphosphoribosyl-dephospho-CoA synthase